MTGVRTALLEVRKEVARHKINVPPNNTDARWLYQKVLDIIDAKLDALVDEKQNG